jgi:hypothetical protein
MVEVLLEKLPYKNWVKSRLNEFLLGNEVVFTQELHKSRIEMHFDVSDQVLVDIYTSLTSMLLKCLKFNIAGKCSSNLFYLRV